MKSLEEHNMIMRESPKTYLWTLNITFNATDEQMDEAFEEVASALEDLPWNTDAEFMASQGHEIGGEE